MQPAEAHALERAVAHHANARVELGDGYELLRAHLPPIERRGLLLIDPPYEESSRDFERARAAIGDALQRFRDRCDHALVSIKDARDTQTWRKRLSASLGVPIMVSEIWVHPCDSRIALNGSGLFMIHPPYQLAQRMRTWLPQLLGMLDAAGSGGWMVEEAPA